MADLGARNRAMRLVCKRCPWIPPETMVMEGILLHFEVEHDTDQPELTLEAACTCGAGMTITDSRPTGGGIKDYLRCGACGNTGYVRRNPE